MRNLLILILIFALILQTLVLQFVINSMTGPWELYQQFRKKIGESLELFDLLRENLVNLNIKPEQKQSFPTPERSKNIVEELTEIFNSFWRKNEIEEVEKIEEVKEIEKIEDVKEVEKVKDLKEVEEVKKPWNFPKEFRFIPVMLGTFNLCILPILIRAMGNVTEKEIPNEAIGTIVIFEIVLTMLQFYYHEMDDPKKK